MISGIHMILYSKHAGAVRAFLDDILELPSVDAGGGWPIFGAPPTELAVHPTDGAPEHELYLMCDDINAVVAKLSAKGVESTPIEDRGWGLVTTITIAGDERLGLYEPRHPSPQRT